MTLSIKKRINTELLIDERGARKIRAKNSNKGWK